MAETEEKEMILCWPPPSPEMSKSTETEYETTKQKTHVVSCKRSIPMEDIYTTPLSAPKRDKPQVEVCADVALARWWRNNQKLLGTSTSPPTMANAHTKLMHIARLPEAQAFLRGEVTRLASYVDKDYSGDLAILHHALGTMYERLGDCPKAYQHLRMAHMYDNSGSEVAWALERILRQLKVTTAQVTAAFQLTRDMSRPIPQQKPVERRMADSLTYTEFLMKYAMTHTPVVIIGLADVITKCAWTLDHIDQVAGTCRLHPRVRVKGSAEWAGLECGPEVTVSELITRVQHPTDQDRHSPLYLFDWSLPLNCPQLASQLTIPKYFAGDLLQRTSPGSLYRESWPSLFVAPQGAVSDLHVDAFGSNFWMALLSGKKRWVIFNQEDTPLLYPRYWHSLDPVFDIDINDPDLDRHPLLQLTNPREVTLEEGEVLFVPAGCAHRVQNLTPSVAISSNFVDASNLSGVCTELLTQSLIDPRAQELLTQLRASSFDSTPNTDQPHLTFEQFKAQKSSSVA